MSVRDRQEVAPPVTDEDMPKPGCLYAILISTAFFFWAVILAWRFFHGHH